MQLYTVYKVIEEYLVYDYGCFKQLIESVEKSVAVFSRHRIKLWFIRGARAHLNQFVRVMAVDADGVCV